MFKLLSSDPGRKYWVVLILSMLLVFPLGCSNSSDDSDNTQVSLGGANDDYLPLRGNKVVYQTADGGFIVAADTYSDLGADMPAKGGNDCWVVKLDRNLNVQWQTLFGGSGSDSCKAVLKVSSGGYLVAASTESKDGDVKGYKGGGDIWLVMLNSSGAILWSKCYGGKMWDEPSAVIEVDNGFVVAGYSNSNDGDKIGGYGSLDGWMFKIDPTGDLIWQKSFGGESRDFLYAVKQTSDKGLVAVGMSASCRGQMRDNKGGVDIMAVKVSSNGTLEWFKALGGKENEYASAIVEDGDKNIIIAGAVAVDGKNWDVLCMKLDTAGKVIWNKNYGGSFSDEAYDLILSDGDAILVGESFSNDGDFPGLKGASDIILARIGSQGELKAVGRLGGSDKESSGSIIQTSSGGDKPFLVSGWTKSKDGDVKINHGKADVWLVRVDRNFHP